MNHVYEMRMYYATPGKLDALLARFANHTEALFARYGIHTIGYWVPQDNPKNILLYIVEHESADAAARNWTAFRADQEWLRIKTETDTPVPLVASIDCFLMDKIDLAEFKTGVSSKA